MSNSQAVNLATWEQYVHGVNTVQNCLRHMALLGGLEKDEEIQEMVNHAYAVAREEPCSRTYDVLESLVARYSSLEQPEPREEEEQEGEDEPVGEEDEQEIVNESYISGKISVSTEAPKVRDWECCAP